MEGEEAPRRRASGVLQTFASQPLPEAMEGLEMGPLIGSGSFGKGELTGGMVAAWVWRGMGE